MPSDLVTLLFFVALVGLIGASLRFTVLGRGFSVPLRDIPRGHETFEYPEKPRPVAPRFHGRHQLNRYEDGLEKCIGCELCAWACPADAIYVQGAENTKMERFSPGERYAEDYQINYQRCIFCGLCIEACPTRALTMTHDYELSEADRDDLVYGKERLLAPSEAGDPVTPQTDAEVRARGINYYGGDAVTPPSLVGGVFADATSSKFQRANSLIGALSPAELATVGDGSDDLTQGEAAGNRPDEKGKSSCPVEEQLMDTASTAEVVLFWVFGVLAIGTGLAMLTMRNIVHAALMLVLNFFAISALYLGLESPFLSIVQIIVYAGAIMILFLFVIMLLGVDRDDSAIDDRVAPKIVAGLLSFVVVAGVLFSLAGTFTDPASACGDLVTDDVAAAADHDDVICRGLASVNAQDPQGSVGVIGERLFTRYSFSFEMAAVLLTVATLGAMVLGRRHELEQDDDKAWASNVTLPSLADAEAILANALEGDEEPAAWAQELDASSAASSSEPSDES